MIWYNEFKIRNGRRPDYTKLYFGQSAFTDKIGYNNGYNLK